MRQRLKRDAWSLGPREPLGGPLSTETHVGGAQGSREIRIHTLLSPESGSASPSAANNVSTEASGASLPTFPFSNTHRSRQCGGRTIEMGSINIKAEYAAGCTEFDYTPREFCVSTKACTLVEKGVSPVIGRVVASAFPTAEECTFRAVLSLQTRRWLRRPSVKVIAYGMRGWKLPRQGGDGTLPRRNRRRPMLPCHRGQR
jgi:hypothetical protein